MAMQEEGPSKEESVQRIWMVDSKGLLVKVNGRSFISFASTLSRCFWTECDVQLFCFVLFIVGRIRTLSLLLLSVCWIKPNINNWCLWIIIIIIIIIIMVMLVSWFSESSLMPFKCAICLYAWLALDPVQRYIQRCLWQLQWFKK